MPPQLTEADEARTPSTALVPADAAGIPDATMRQLLGASSAMRRSDDPDHILDILISTVLHLAPVSSAWAGWKSPGGPLSHTAAFDPSVGGTGAAGARRLQAALDVWADRLEATLDAWADRLRSSSSPFEVAGADSPFADPVGGPDRLLVFPMSSSSRLGALLIAEATDAVRAHESAIALLCDRASAALELVGARAADGRGEALFETITQLAASYSDPELVLQTIVRSTARVLGTDAAYVMLVDDERRTLRVRTAHGITRRSFYESSISIDAVFPGEAIRRRRVVCVRDLMAHDEAKNSRSEGLRTTICAPMFVEDELVGVLMASHREVRDMSREDRGTLMALANAAAVAIRNVKLYGEHEESIQRLGEVNRLLEERSAAGERTMAFQQRLTSLILEAGGLDEIVSIMTDTLGCRVVILDRELAVLHGSPGTDDLDLVDLRRQVARLSDATGIAQLQSGDDHLLVAPLDLSGARSAYVVVVAEGAVLEGADLGMTEAAVTAIGLELMRDRATAEAEARLTGGLFQTLLSGEETDEATIIRRASYLGLELSGQNAVIAVTAEPRAGARQPLSLETCIQRALRRRREGPIAVFEREEAIYIVLSDPEEVPPGLIKEYAALIKQELDVSGRSAGVRIAFAGPHLGIAGVRKAVEEAGYALHVLGVLGRNGKPQAFGDLGIWTLLGSVGDPEHLMSFASSVLGVLIAHDAERQSQLVDTVRTLVECNFHYRTAAELAFTHPNTLRYRMSRIHELTGLDFTHGDDRLRVELALRILDVIGVQSG